MKNVRVRFAPSPTGGLHLGGVRTALYNYLFAKKHNGTFVLRIEDTDQTRFVEGAEKYIVDCLNWCGIAPTESPELGGNFGPYRQSERKNTYMQYAQQLVKDGFAYYAFDTTVELEKMRADLKTDKNPSPQYDAQARLKMKNSLTLNESEVKQLLQNNTPFVIRIKVPTNETISFTDLIRGEVSFDTNTLDDKVLLKADGMPTYHLAVVVDDYAMQISHAFRGEEWLPSAPIHILLWQYLGWQNSMPQWAHLPLILKPDGNGKLSKRDGDRLGFPVFAMDWHDPKTNETTIGFKEKGFMPAAFINMLAMLGWNYGTEQELFTLAELCEKFDLERVHKNGAKFDYEKAKWYNHEWIKKSEAAALLPAVKAVLQNHKIEIKEDNFLQEVIQVVKERCTLLNDFVEQSSFFFKAPATFDLAAIQPKWNADKAIFFTTLIEKLQNEANWKVENIENTFKELATAKNIKAGELQLPLRIMLVGAKFGPSVFTIAQMIGKEETVQRINYLLTKISNY